MSFFRQYALERVILELIAGFAGWSVLLPCQCCYNEPLVFCMKQHKTFLVKDLGPLFEHNIPGNSDKWPLVPLIAFQRQERMACYPCDVSNRIFAVPATAFQAGRRLFQEEYIPFSNTHLYRYASDEESWQQVGQMLTDPMFFFKNRMALQPPGGLVNISSCSGLGYIVLNEWGFVAPITSAAWSEVNWKTLQVVKGSLGKRSVAVFFEKKLVAKPAIFEYGVYWSEQARIDSLAEVKKLDSLRRQGQITWTEHGIAESSARGIRLMQKEVTKEELNHVGFTGKFKTKKCAIRFLETLAALKRQCDAEL
jgi:hypothetical protein